MQILQLGIAMLAIGLAAVLLWITRREGQFVDRFSPMQRVIWAERRVLAWLLFGVAVFLALANAIQIEFSAGPRLGGAPSAWLAVNATAIRLLVAGIAGRRVWTVARVRWGWSL